MLTPFDSLLVANRGEIACRVIRTARALGLRTISVFSDADADAPHVALADDAVRIGPAPAGDSYLKAQAIFDAARLSEIDPARQFPDNHQVEAFDHVALQA